MTTANNLPSQRQDFISAVKRHAFSDNSGLNQSHSTRLDKIACALGHKNWSMFHKKIRILSDPDFNQIRTSFYKRFRGIEFVEIKNEPISTVAFDESEAIQEMKVFIRKKYTPLIEFAFYDSETENGYADDGVDLHEELSEEFYKKFPDALIDRVANDMELNYGPWGIEALDGYCE